MPVETVHVTTESNLHVHTIVPWFAPWVHTRVRERRPPGRGDSVLVLIAVELHLRVLGQIALQVVRLHRRPRRQLQLSDGDGRQARQPLLTTRTRTRTRTVRLGTSDISVFSL